MTHSEPAVGAFSPSYGFASDPPGLHGSSCWRPSDVGSAGAAVRGRGARGVAGGGGGRDFGLVSADFYNF